MGLGRADLPVFESRGAAADPAAPAFAPSVCMDTVERVDSAPEKRSVAAV